MIVRHSKPIDLAPPARPCTIREYRTGSTFVLVMVGMVVLMTLGLGMLTVAWGARHRAVMLKSEATAMLAAEAGYEKGVYWMCRQPDMLGALRHGVSGTAGSLAFADSRCNYSVRLHTFLKHRPVYRVISQGHSGAFGRTVDVFMVQAISGWDMGMCRVASGAATTNRVNFANGEIIDIPVHINNQKDSPDARDIYISRNPTFKQLLSMGEPRHTPAGSDKYANVMDCFDGGICFSQPDSRITDEEAVAEKMDRFRETTKPDFIFRPELPRKNSDHFFNDRRLSPIPAVQIEFYVDNQNSDTGKVAITRDCVVAGFRQDRDSRTWDFRITPGSDGDRYERYDIYAYHVARRGHQRRVTNPVENTYVTQSFGEYESEPGGQIFVHGNVIIGGNRAGHNNDQVVKGKMMIVATGNIWIADSIHMDGPRDADGRPGEENENVLGLMARGVIRVVDPGMNDPDLGRRGRFEPESRNPFEYVPIGRPDFNVDEDHPDYHKRHLPDPTVIEAAITVGGGGWGAENVRRGNFWRYDGGRKERSGRQDSLILRGTLVEAIRGVVGLPHPRDGYMKKYYFDERLLEGILPADIWLRGKYVPAPAGWHDYRSGGLAGSS